MAKQSKSYERSTSGLRDALFDELQDLRDGLATPQEARAAADLAGRIIESLEVEIRAQQLELERRAALLPPPIDHNE